VKKRKNRTIINHTEDKTQKNAKDKKFRGIRKTQRKKEQAARETHFER
jgi:hypothetical protein